MAGIGVKPPTRSGPCFSIVWTVAAAISSPASSHAQRTKPPRPRSDRWLPSAATAANAATGSPVLPFSSRQRSSRLPRT